jgi:hypothetical protein
MGGRELLVSCSDDFTLFLWDPADTKKAVVRMVGHQQPVNHILFSPGELLCEGLLRRQAGRERRRLRREPLTPPPLLLHSLSPLFRRPLHCLGIL